MRKIIVIGLLVWTLLGHAPIAESQKQISNSSSSAQTPQSDKRGTPESPLVVNAHAIQSNSEAAEEKTRDADQKHNDRWLIGLTFAIAMCAAFQFFGILGQIFVYLQQTRIMKGTLGTINRQADLMDGQTRILKDSVDVARRAAEAAQKSANVAEQSAQAFINRERARLFIRPNISGNFDAVFHVENLGSSPALVYYGFVGCEIIRKDQDLPLPPDYTHGDPEWVFGRADWVTNNESVWVGHYSADYIDKTENPELYEDVMAGRDVVWFYGIVRYEDVVSGRGEEIRFCYRCHAFPDGKSFLSEVGPAEYRDRHPYDKPN